MRISIITISDRSARGERDDLTGPALRQMLEAAGAEVAGVEIVPDERDQIRGGPARACDSNAVDIVLTNGGTGLAPRDITPEVTEEIIERRIPGLPEAMRSATLKFTPYAMLSRVVAGVRNQTLIVNLPGSPKGAKECLEVILPVLAHITELLQGKADDSSHHAKAER